MRRDRLKVVIVGAGIGGLSAHLACARAGFDVEHFERQPHLTGARSARLIEGSAWEGQLTGAVVPPRRNGAIAAPNSPGPTEFIPPSAIASDAKGGPR